MHSQISHEEIKLTSCNSSMIKEEVNSCTTQCDTMLYFIIDSRVTLIPVFQNAVWASVVDAVASLKWFSCCMHRQVEQED